VRVRLPLLAQQRWADRAKRGYARGWEPVQFVDRIQRFLTLLEWQPGEATAQSEPATAAPGANAAPASNSALAPAADEQAAKLAGAHPAPRP